MTAEILITPPKAEGQIIHPNAEAAWKVFIDEAPFVQGGAQPWSLPRDVPWFDEARVNRGLRFVQEYLALHAFTIFMGNIIAAVIKPFCSTFFRDHQLYPENVWFERSLKGVKFWMGWNYPRETTDATGRVVKEMRKVRGIHSKHASVVDTKKKLLPLPDHMIPERCHKKAKEIRELFQDVPVPDVPPYLKSWDPRVPFSQFALAFSGIGASAPFWTMPIIKNNLRDKTGLTDYKYSMALGLRVFGVQDKYNLSLCNDPAIPQMVVDLGLTFLKEIDATAYYLMEPSLNMTSKVGLTANVVLHVVAEQAGVECKKLWEVMNWMERTVVYLSNKGLVLYLRFRPFRILANILSKIIFKMLFLIFLKPSKDSRNIRKKNRMDSYYQEQATETENGNGTECPASA